MINHQRNLNYKHRISQLINHQLPKPQ